MASLVVRNIDDEMVRGLNARAGLHGISAEAKHRKILESILLGPKRKSFAEALISIPDVSVNSDFERMEDNGGASVFD
jgi:plasmid stability protein